MEEERTQLELQNKLMKKLCSTLIEIEEIKKEILTYSKFIDGLSKSGIKLDRKILAEIAYENPQAFKTIVKKAQSALS